MQLSDAREGEHLPAGAIPSSRRLLDFVAEHRFLCLLVALLSFFVTSPVLRELNEFLDPSTPRLIESAIFIIVLTAAVISTSRSRSWKMVVLLLALPTIILWVLPVPLASIHVKVM